MKTARKLWGPVTFLLLCLVVASCGSGPGGGTDGPGDDGIDNEIGGSDEDTDGETSPDQDIESPENSPGGSTSTGNPGVTSVTFNLSGAIGLAIDDSPSSRAVRQSSGTGSNLKRVNVDRTLSDAITTGSLTVDQFMVAANNQVYLLLETAVDNCLLVRIDGDTGEATCVDNTLTAFNWDNAFGDPIQFDGEGTVYYFGSTSDGSTVLRANASGTTTNLINDNISLEGFVVLEDSTVYLSGTTISTGEEWTRRLPPDGALETLLRISPDFLSLFPDENIYYGASEGLVRGVGRYLSSTNEVDSEGWISADGTGAYYDCPVDGSDCGVIGSMVRMTNGKVFATVDDMAGRNNLVQYYPTVDLPILIISDVTIAESILTYLIMAGLDDSDTHRLTMFETNSGSETDLLGGEEIEAYHVAYLNSANHQIVMFDGLRFSDGSYVLCQVDLTGNNTLTCSKTGTNRLTDFQLFNE